MIKLFELSPADVKKKYGDVLFGSHSNLAALQNKEYEKDTKTEEKLYDILSKWFMFSSSTTSVGIEANLNDLLALQKYFPAILRPPYGRLAYRGTSIDLDDLKSFLESNKDKIKPFENDYYYIVDTFYPYQPKRKISSWSTDIITASSFEGRGVFGSIPIIFTTKIDDSFIMDPNASDEILSDSGSFDSEEQEIIKFKPEGKYKMIVRKYHLEKLGFLK
jgi:hypothetical protein